MDITRVAIRWKDKWGYISDHPKPLEAMLRAHSFTYNSIRASLYVVQGQDKWVVIWPDPAGARWKAYDSEDAAKVAVELSL